METSQLLMCKDNMAMLIKIQPDATVCRYLFTAKSLYMFRVSTAPIIGSTKKITAASGTDHTVKYKDLSICQCITTYYYQKLTSQHTLLVHSS